MPDTAVEQARPAPADDDSMPSMSFLEHLEELRRRILYSLAAIAVGFLAAWGASERIFGYMQVPIMDALHRHGLGDKLVYLSPVEPFNMYLKIGFLAGVALASPVVLYQVWMFVSPGLYRHEKRYLLPFMFSALGLFAAGGYFGYRIVYPAALDFLIGYGEQFQPMITIGAYTDLFLTVILGLGVVFQMPIIIFFLALMKVVSARFLWKNFRYAVLIIFIVAAILTPTTDIVNLMIFSGPMLVLYLLSIGVAAIVNPREKRA